MCVCIQTCSLRVIISFNIDVCIVICMLALNILEKEEFWICVVKLKQDPCSMYHIVPQSSHSSSVLISPPFTSDIICFDFNNFVFVWFFVCFVYT